MKNFFLRTALSVAVFATCAGQASAASINLDGDLGTIANSVKFFNPTVIVPVGTSFGFGWSFTVAAPYTSLTASINWTPNTAISDFAGTVYSVDTCTTSAGTAGTCNTLSAVGSFVQNGVNAFNMPDSSGGRLSLSPGTYAYYFTGTTPNPQGETEFGFSGQSRAYVPAPAALGLLGIGLLGMGLTRRRSGVTPTAAV